MNNKINKTGYLKGSPTENNNYNIIPGNKITMKNVEKNLIAIKLDKKGKPIGMEFMKPGKDYKFDNTYSVLEVPQYREGGPGEVKKKKKLSKEDIENIRAATGLQFDEISANKLFEPDTEETQPMPPLNFGSYAHAFSEVKGNNGVYNVNIDDYRYSEAKSTMDYLRKLNPGRELIFGKQGKSSFQVGGMTNQFIPIDDSLEGIPQNILDSMSNQIDISGGQQNTPLDTTPNKINNIVGEKELPNNLKKYANIGNKKINFNIDETNYESLNSGISKDLNTSSNEELKVQKPFEQSEFDKIQFFNSYGGVDIPTAATTLGQSISNKDTLGTVASSLKLVTGLGRNVLGGLGAQKRTNETMKSYYEKLREDGNVTSLQSGGSLNNGDINFEIFQSGGLKKEELLTGEYITGVSEDDKLLQHTNAEIEKGEYFATKDGDIAEVKGNKHSSGGEKIIMEYGDRVLTDYTKLGASNAKYIRDKFDIKVKAKNTYADALDKYRTKSGMSKLIKEEESILKQIEKQKELEDSETKNLNNKFLEKKLSEITSKKSPLEEGRKFLYNELYILQEKDKPKAEQNFLQDGGGKKELPEYLGQDYLTGEGVALGEIPKGQSITEQGFFGGISDTEFAKTKTMNPWFDWSNFDPSNSEDVKKFQTEYNKLSSKGSQVTVDGKFGQQTQSIYIPWLVPEKPVIEDKIQEEVPNTKKQGRNALLLPDQYPMVPEGTQPVLKNTRRYDRVEGAQIDPTKYLQQLNNQAQIAKSKNEGLSPNVKIAADANIDANIQKAISDTMLRIDASNIQSKNNAEITNARIQGREEDARLLDNLSFEKRQLTADAKTDLAYQEYFDKIQQVILGNFRQVNAINNANARHDNIQFDGNGYIVRDAPDFTKNLNATQLAQINTLLAKYEEGNKKKTN